MKTAIYCRLSEEDKNKQIKTDESESIQNQKSMLTCYALEQGWEIYGIYSDDDYTGADRKRPEFNRLIEDAKMHKFDIVLCKTQSRFTRELELVERYIHGLFPSLGIRFVSIVDNADTLNKGNKKSRQINGLINEWYLEDMSENIKSVLTNKRKNGSHIGSFALYGYKKDPINKGHLIVDEEAAKVVREIFTLYSQGYGKTAIARILNDRNIPNPTEYKRLKGLLYKQPKFNTSALWKYSTISDMLKNEIYLGNMVQGKYGSISYKTKQNKPRPKEQWYKVEKTHQPVIEAELWNSVQKRLTDNARPLLEGTISPFAGKVKCISCGCTMRTTKTKERHYYQCTTRHFSKAACTGSFIAVELLEKTVITELSSIVSKYIDKAELNSGLELADSLKDQTYTLKSNLSAYEKNNSELTKCIKNLYLDRARETISDKEFTKLFNDFTAEKDRLEQAIAKTEKQLSEIEALASSDNGHKQLIEQYLYPQKLSREYLDTLIDYILVGRRIAGTCDVPVEIHWNF